MSLFLSDTCSDWSNNTNSPLSPTACTSSWSWSDDHEQNSLLLEERDLSMSPSIFSTRMSIPTTFSPSKRLWNPEELFSSCSSFSAESPSRKLQEFITVAPREHSNLMRTSTPRVKRSTLYEKVQMQRKRRRIDEGNRQALSQLDRSDHIEGVSDNTTSFRDTSKSSPSTSMNSSFGSWSLSDVLGLNGCVAKCASERHSLTEYEILAAHANFASKSSEQQRQWLFDYFTSNCPNDINGGKDPKSMKYVVSGKEVCLLLWLSILSVSSSRFYDVRKEFSEGKSRCNLKKCTRSRSPKSCQAIAWLTSYFERVGDKRPDKADAIYLPTCLTEKSIYVRMIDELHKGDKENAICFSQFNRLFNEEFPNVTIPKVCPYVIKYFFTLS